MSHVGPPKAPMPKFLVMLCVVAATLVILTALVVVDVAVGEIR